MKPIVDRLLVAGAAVLILLLTANVFLMFRNTQQVREGGAQVMHTREVIGGVDNLLLLAIDAEAAQHGFIITGEDSYLGLYRTALNAIRAQLKELEEVTAGDAFHAVTLPRVRQHLTKRVELLEESIALRSQIGFERAQQVVADGRGRREMEAFREVICEMDDYEQNVLQERMGKSSAIFRSAMITGLLANLAALAASGAFMLMLRRDLSDRSAASNVIAEHAERLRVTLASIADAVITTNIEGYVTHLNVAAETLTGWTNADAMGLPLERVFHIVNESTREKVESPAARALREGVIVGPDNHTLLIAKNGVERAIDDSAAPIRSKTGETLGSVLVFRDVTERWRAGQALRTSEARKSAILTSALDCVISMDHEGKIVDFNPAAERTFGCKRDDVLGHTVAETIIPPGMREAHERGLAHLKATGEGPVLGRRLELTALRSDGAEFPCELSITMTRIENEPPFFTAYLRDITESKMAREALRSHAAELARADRNKDEFLAMLAHELRNPLAPLRNAVEIVRSADADTEERAQAEDILARQIENMRRMIDDLLDVSRITEGKIELKRAPVTLASILNAAVTVVRSHCAGNRQNLKLELPPEDIWLNADATRLEQVFGNLLGNASKYSGEGSHIMVTGERVQGTMLDEVEVRVCDDGCGITDELLPHVFDLFVQGSRALDRTHGGLGIGLSLVQRIVALHGGTVKARSEGPGKGAEFIVRLPVLNAPPTEPVAPLLQKMDVPRRLLIVDDNLDAARSLATLQNRRGHETRTVFTGPDAIEAAREFQPDAVLLDIGLPGMDGFEVARRIRSMSFAKRVLVIAMSGYGRKEDIEAARNAGFDDYLIKPIDLNLLRDWLRDRIVG